MESRRTALTMASVVMGDAQVPYGAFKGEDTEEPIQIYE